MPLDEEDQLKSDQIEDAAMEAEFSGKAPEGDAAAKPAETDDRSDKNAEGQGDPELDDSDDDKDTDKNKASAEEGKPDQDQQQPEYMEEINKLRTDFTAELKKVAGSVNGLKGYVQNLSKKATQEADSQGADTPTTQQVATAMKDADTYAKLKKDFPEWGEAMDAQMGVFKEDILKSLESKQGKIDPKEIENLVSQQVQQYEEKQNDRLIRKQFPDWQQTIKSEPFIEWYRKQPEEIQALASSDDYEDALTMLGKFDASVKAQSNQQQRNKRLEGALDPTNGSRKAPASQALTEDDYMELEFRA